MNSKKLLRVVAAVVLVASGTVALEMSPAAAVTPGSGGTYTLANGASGKCLEVPGTSTANGTLLTQAACTAGATRQQWTLTASGANYSFTNVGSGKCIDLPSGSTVSGTQFQQYSCGTPNNNRLFSLTASAAASGKYRIANVGSAQCVSDKDGSTAGNNPIVQEACSDIARMQWLFNSVSGTPTPTTTTTSTVKPTVAKDGTGSYTTVQAAINAVSASNTSRKVITIKAGTYRENVTIDKPFVTLQGLGSSASQTVIVNNHSAGAYGTTGSATVYVPAKEFQATNITFSNDYDEAANGSSQALAMRISGDRAVMKNVRLLADQDTLLAENRLYVKSSYIEGTVDFIYGGGSAVFDACQIYEKRTTGGPITAANTDAAKTYGFLFYKSTITGLVNNTTQLGRPWRQDAQVTFRESSLSATIATAQPWIDMGTATWKNARFYEYKNTGAGATINSNRKQLTDAQAVNYTPAKYLAGSDGWNPL
jgi:pectinesterase